MSKHPTFFCSKFQWNFSNNHVLRLAHMISKSKILTYANKYIAIWPYRKKRINLRNFRIFNIYGCHGIPIYCRSPLILCATSPVYNNSTYSLSLGVRLKPRRKNYYNLREMYFSLSMWWLSCNVSHTCNAHARRIYVCVKQKIIIQKKREKKKEFNNKILVLYNNI